MKKFNFAKIASLIAVCVVLFVAFALCVCATETTAKDVFDFKGYSVGPNGEVSFGYTLNRDAKNELGDVKIGFVIVQYDKLNGQAPLDANGNPTELENGRVINFSLDNYNNVSYNLKLIDFAGELRNVKYVICPYLCDGTTVYYFEGEEPSDTVTGVSYNEIFVAACEHTDVEVLEGTAATCTEAGLTEGEKCTVCGKITVEQQVIEALGHADENGDYKCDNNCGGFVLPEEGEALTIEQVLAIGALTKTTQKYYVTGTITKVYNTQYGNMYITDGTNELTIYGLYSADGSTRYDAMDEKPVVGDEITVYGIIDQYDNKAQIKNAWLNKLVQHTHDYSEATCEARATCSICGATTGDYAEHNMVDGVCSECGHIDGTEDLTLTFDANKANRTEYSTLIQVWEQNGIKLTNNKGKGNNIGDYANPARFYKDSEIIIAVAGKTITKIVFECDSSSYATALANSISGATANDEIVTVTLNAPAESFTINLTSGQTRINNVTVTVCTHKTTSTVVTAPTCTTAGYTTYTCAVCGYEYTADEVAAAGHTAGEAVQENYVAAECEKAGSYDSVVYCTVCGDEISRETKTVDALEHNFIDNVCTVCGKEFCTHNYEKVVTAPTCTAAGYTTYTCSDCGRTYTADEVAANGHTEIEIPAVEATCTESGLTAGVKCSVCEVIITEQTVVNATGHSYGETACTVCGAVKPAESTLSFADKANRTEYSTSIQVWEQNGITLTNNKASSTTNVGDYSNPARFYKNSEIIITVEGKSITKIVFDSATGDYLSYFKNTINSISDITATVSNNIITVEFASPVENFTFNATGGQIRFNSITVSTVAACEHTNATQEVTPPTCTTDGYTTYTCPDCEKTFTADEVPATGHTEGEAVEENYVAPNCATEGSYDNVVYCTVCGNEISRKAETVPALDHDFDEETGICKNDGCGVAKHVCEFIDYEVTTDATCEEDGVATSVCTDAECGKTDEKVIPAIGHADENGDYKCDNECGGFVLPEDGEALTIEQVLTIGALTTTEQKYYVTGIITKVENTTYGNVRITDDSGAEILVYGLYTWDKAIRYDAMEYKPIVGDEITVYSIISQYNGTPQLKDAWIDEVVAHTHNYSSVVTDPTCTADGYTTYTCTICNYSYKGNEVVALGHTTDNGTCERCETEIGGSTEAKTFETIFTLGANGSATHADGSSKTTYSETVDGRTLSITSGTNMYTGARDAKGNSAIKLGASSKAGGFTFTVGDDVTSVVIQIAKYKANTTKVQINGTTYTLTKNSNDGAYDEIVIDTTTTKTITLTTVSGGYRAMVNSIIFKGTEK